MKYFLTKESLPHWKFNENEANEGKQKISVKQAKISFRFNSPDFSITEQ